MIDGLAGKRPLVPGEPGLGVLVFFSLIAASGFAVGWAAQTLNVF
jgi:hypothetical protein